MIYLEIADKVSLIQFVSEAKKIGLLKEIDIRSIPERHFPIRIPINLECILKFGGNPLIRKTFGKKMDAVITSYLREAVI